MKKILDARSRRAAEAQTQRTSYWRAAQQQGQAIRLDEGSQDSEVVDALADTLAVRCPNPECGKVHTASLADLAAGRLRCGCGSILDAEDELSDAEASGVEESFDDADALDEAGIDDIEETEDDRPRVKCDAGSGRGCGRTFRLVERSALPLSCPRCGQIWTTRNVVWSRRSARRLAEDAKRLRRRDQWPINRDGDPVL